MGARPRAAAPIPVRARENGITGRVRLEVDIGVSGEVTRARVVGARPPGVFDEAALDYMTRSTFKTSNTNPLRFPIRAGITLVFDIQRSRS